MEKERPTTLLHDNWGASRPLTSEEMEEISRMDERREKVWAIAMISIVMTIAIGLVAWVLSTMPIYP